MMIDATVAPKVGFRSPFGTTVCNVNHINARCQPPLEAVGCTPRFGQVCALRPRNTRASAPAPQVCPSCNIDSLGLVQCRFEAAAHPGPFVVQDAVKDRIPSVPVGTEDVGT